VLLHDLSFIERRSQDTRNYLIGLIAALGLVMPSSPWWWPSSAGAAGSTACAPSCAAKACSAPC
jgi:hypothetical protein